MVMCCLNIVQWNSYKDYLFKSYKYISVTKLVANGDVLFKHCIGVHIKTKYTYLIISYKYISVTK